MTTNNIGDYYHDHSELGYKNNVVSDQWYRQSNKKIIFFLLKDTIYEEE